MLHCFAVSLFRPVFANFHRLNTCSCLGGCIVFCWPLCKILWRFNKMSQRDASAAIQRLLYLNRSPFSPSTSSKPLHPGPAAASALELRPPVEGGGLCHPQLCFNLIFLSSFIKKLLKQDFHLRRCARRSDTSAHTVLHFVAQPPVS